MTVVGSAEVLIVPVTSGFEKALRDEAAVGFKGLAKDSEQAGLLAGANLRGGVGKETGKLADDLTRAGAAGGEGLHKGLSGGLAKVALGLAGAGVAAAAYGVHVAGQMQNAEASIASASGTSVAAAQRIGSAMLDTAGKSEFSGVQMAQAYSAVAGQLKATEGHALSAAQAMDVMSAAEDLATAKGVDLGTATSTVVGVMQAFHLQTEQAGHVSDVLYRASTATGQSIGQLGGELSKVRSKLGDTAGPVQNLAGLLVDMTDQGVTGRAAISGLNTGLNGLLKPTTTGAAEIKNLGLRVFDASGQFVGFGSLIDQLRPKLAGMTEQQRLQAATDLFGTGAARQMLAVIQAGPDAYQKATASVNEHGSAQAAAAKQSSTLKVEEETLKAEVVDLAGKIGTFLIPIITTMVGAFTKATTFVLDHKAVLIALGGVITTILGPALAVFAINKMGQFRQSFVDASKNAKQFASDIESVVQRVVSAFTKQNAAATKMGSTTQAQSAKASTAVEGQATATEASAGKIGTAEGTIASETTASTSTVETENATAGQSFRAEGGAAATAATDVGVAEGTVTTEVTAADATIETENATAAASFAGVLGPLIAIGAITGPGLAKDFGSVISGGGVDTTGVAKLKPGYTIRGGKVVPISQPGSGQPTSGSGSTVGNVIGEVSHLFHAKGDKVSSANMFMAGEEGPGHPEYVIATNPAYRGRNLGLWTMAGHDLGIPGYAQGGVPGWSGSQNAVASELMRIFEGAGLSAAGAAAIVGNWMQESSLNPSSPGGYLGQWQGDRFSNLQAYAAAHHESPTSVAAQAGFALQELRQSYGSLLSELKTTTNAAKAAVDVSNVYERPATWAANLPNRESSATAARAAFGGSGAVPVHVVKVAPEYVNPLGRATATVGRTDQGKDWTNIKGPIQAIGQGIITQVYSNLSGFGQTVIEKLTSGSHKGEYLYYAMESGGRATIHSGARVRTGQTIGYGLGSGGVEFGQWNPNTGHAAGYVPGTTSGAVTPAGTAYANWIAGLPHSAAPTATSVAGEVGGFLGPTPAQVAASQLAAARARVAAEIAQETAQVGGEVARLRAGLKPHHRAPGDYAGHIDPLALVPATPEHRIKAEGEIAALTAALHIQVESQKMSVGEHTKVSKAELAKQTTDLKSGADAFALLATAVHSGSMAKLTAALATVHKMHLAKLEESLKQDQGTALAKLSEQLIKVHMEAQRTVAKDQVHAIRASLAPKHMTVLGPDGSFHTVTVHPSALQREQAGVQIAATEASLHLHLQEQRRALGEHASLSRKQIREQGGELHKGTGIFSSLSAAVASGDPAKLQAALVAAHDAHLTSLEHQLHGDHSQALQKLNEELKAVHKQAMSEYVKEAAAAERAKAQASADASTAQHLTVAQAVATAQAGKIADATKVYLDRQAEHGLKGTSLTAAKAQTAYDRTVQAADTAINAAQVHVAQAATGSKHAQAVAAAELAAAQVRATIAEAQAQAILDKANAKAQQQSGGGGTPGSPGTPGVPTVNNSFTIIGEGLDANGVMRELMWALKTGSLPVRPPLVAVPA